MEKINIKGQVVTIDAMGTQTAIVETIRRKRGEYVLALKGNQKILCEEVSLFLNDEEEKKKIKQKGIYKKTREKAHAQIEIREYYQTEEIKWLESKKEWKGLKSIGMEEKTISILYKQFERRYRIIFKVGERTLECREYALAFRCNI